MTFEEVAEHLARVMMPPNDHCYGDEFCTCKACLEDAALATVEEEAIRQVIADDYVRRTIT